jgi:hypothetical protein
LETLVHQESLAQLEKTVPLGSLEVQVCQERQAHQESEGTEGKLAILVTKVQGERLVTREDLVHLDKMELLESLVLLDQWDHKDNMEYQDKMGYLELKGRGAQRVQRVKKEIMV